MSDPTPRVPNIPNLNLNNLKVPKPRRFAFLIAFGIAALILFNLLSRSFVSVDANEIGVKIVRGKVKGTLDPGWHLISPIGGDVKKFSTRLQQTSMIRNSNEGDRAGDDSVEAASIEGATISVDLTVNYRLEPRRAVKLFNTIRDETDLRERIVRPGVRSVVRDIFANYKAKDAITTKRVEIQQRIQKGLGVRFEGQGILIETVDVRELYLPENIQAQVNEAIAAEAAAQKAEINRKQKETEAETARLVAEKNAERARIEAKGTADARKISAEGEAEANRKIAESLTPGLIQLRQIEAVYKNGNQVYFLPQGASPNVFLTPTQNVGTPSTPSPSEVQAATSATTDTAAG